MTGFDIPLDMVISTEASEIHMEIDSDPEYEMVAEGIISTPFDIPLDMVISMETPEIHMEIDSDPECEMIAEGIISTPADPYQGEYIITPAQYAQVLGTEGCLMDQNITVNPIPQNYGLITWDGSAITVS